MSNKGKVVLTGANGFIGSHLAEKLLELGYEVHCIVRESSNLKWIENKGFTIHKCGLENIDALVPVFANARFVFHLAGVVAALKYEIYHHGNVVLTQNILEACLKSDGKPEKIVVTSSLAVGGPTTRDRKIKESDGFDARVRYGQAKVEQEQLCQDYMDRLSITIARPSVISGERETELFEFIKTVDSGVVPLVGFSDKYAGVIDIHDLINALIAMAESDKTAGEAYYLSSEEVVSWKQLSDICAAKMNKKVLNLRLPVFVILIAGFFAGLVGRLRGKPPVFDFEKAKEGIHEAWICDVSKAKEHFGFKQTISVKESVERAIDWYKKEGWL